MKIWLTWEAQFTFIDKCKQFYWTPCKPRDAPASKNLTQLLIQMSDVNSLNISAAVSVSSQECQVNYMLPISPSEVSQVTILRCELYKKWRVFIEWYLLAFSDTFFMSKFILTTILRPLLIPDISERLLVLPILFFTKFWMMQMFPLWILNFSLEIVPNLYVHLGTPSLT